MAAKRLSDFREIVALYGRELLERYRTRFVSYWRRRLPSDAWLMHLFSLLPCDPSYQLTDRVCTYGADRHRAVREIPCPFDGTRIVGTETRKLFRESGLIVLVVWLAAIFSITTFTNIPDLEVFTTQRFIRVQ